MVLRFINDDDDDDDYDDDDNNNNKKNNNNSNNRVNYAIFKYHGTFVNQSAPILIIWLTYSNKLYNLISVTKVKIIWDRLLFNKSCLKQKISIMVINKTANHFVSSIKFNTTFNTQLEIDVSL